MREIYFRKAPRSQLGFSLIEIMVSVVLMGMMGTILMTSLNSSIRAKDTVEEISARYQVVRQAMARMAREISMSYLSRHINLQEPAFMTQFKGNSESLYFSAFGNVVRQKDAHQTDQQVLGFYLANDKSGQKSLMRRQQPNLNLDVEKGGRAYVLCPNVKSLAFSYYDDRYEKWDESWHADPAGYAEQAASLDKDQKKQQAEVMAKEGTPKPWRLPRYVKISMTVEMSLGTEMTWITEAEIPIQEPLDLH